MGIVKVMILVSMVAACGQVRDLMGVDEQLAYDKMVARELVLKEEIAKADPGSTGELENELTALEIEIAKVEGAAVRRSLGPVASAFTSLPVVGPYFALAGPFAGTLLLPLFSRRGRKHYRSMVKNVTPGLASSDGSHGLSITAALVDLARAFGLAHSSEASAKAAERPA